MREAIVSISDADIEALGLGELEAVFREAGLRDFEELACQGSGAVVQAEVDRRADEARLDGLAYVEQWEHIERPDGHHLYVVEFVVPALSEGITEHTDQLVGNCTPEVSADGNTMSLVGPQEAIRGTIEAYERAGVSPELRRLGTYRGGETPLESLTDRQREIVRTAYRMGYYEVPREATNEDVAAEIGVNPSTVTEHLQRAERNLLASHLQVESSSRERRSRGD